MWRRGGGRGLGDDEKNYKLWSCSFKFAEKLVQHPIKGRTIKHHQEENFCKRTKTSFAAAISPECKLNKTMLKPPSALHHSHSAHLLDLTLLRGKSRPNVCPLQQQCFITSLLRCCSELGMGWLGMSRKKCMENISSILCYLCPTPWPWWGHGGMYPSCAGGLFKFLSQLRTSAQKQSTAPSIAAIWITLKNDSFRTQVEWGGWRKCTIFIPCFMLASHFTIA